MEFAFQAPTENAVSSAVHLIAGSSLVAIASPTRITGIRCHIAWAARALWAGWSAVSTHDLEIERKRRLEALLDRKNCVSALQIFDGALQLAARHRAPVANIVQSAQSWADCNKLDRRDIMRARMQPLFYDAAADYYQRRLNLHFSDKAVLLKSFLGGFSLGGLTYASCFFKRYDGPRKIDEALFGQLDFCNPDSSKMDIVAAAAAVCNGIEDIAWYRGVFEGETEKLESNLPRHQQVFDRRDKESLHTKLVQLMLQNRKYPVLVATSPSPIEAEEIHHLKNQELDEGIWKLASNKTAPASISLPAATQSLLVSIIDFSPFRVNVKWEDEGRIKCKIKRK